MIIDNCFNAIFAATYKMGSAFSGAFGYEINGHVLGGIIGDLN
jgi:hypothetical protein